MRTSTNRLSCPVFDAEDSDAGFIASLSYPLHVDAAWQADEKLKPVLQRRRAQARAQLQDDRKRAKKLASDRALMAKIAAWHRKRAEELNRVESQSIRDAIIRHIDRVRSAPFDDQLVKFIADAARAWDRAPLIRLCIIDAREGGGRVS